MNHMGVLDLIVNAIAGGSFLGFLTFVIIYSKRNWRSTAPGRALMLAVTGLCVTLLTNTVHLFTGRYPGIEFVRMPVYLFLFFAAWNLVYTVVHSIRQGDEIEPKRLFSRKEKRD